MDLPTYDHTHTHTPQHSIHIDCVEQSLFPHIKHKGKTAQTKKTDKSKAKSVVCYFKSPHPHKEQKTDNTWLD
jgi:hypothetical protein